MLLMSQKVLRADVSTFMGFRSLPELIESSFGHAFKPAVIFLAAFFSLVAEFFDTYMGLSALAYVAFILLFLMELGTGIAVSLKKGQKIVSRKFIRMAVKIVVYTLMIAIVNTLRNHIPSTSVFGFEMNFYEYVFYIIIHLIIFTLLISIFENLTALGYHESSKILSVIVRKFNKWFDLDDSHDPDFPKNK